MTMTADTRHSIVEHSKERGSALVGVLLLLLMMSALAAALGVSGQTETLVSRNQRSGAQAHAAAEAGLSHAVELAIASLGGGGTINDLLADANLGLGGAAQTIAPGITATYTVSVRDDAGGPGEDALPANDANGMVIITATGRGQDDTAVTLEAMIGGGGASLPAFFVNGPVEIKNPFEVSGAAGDFHINGNLTGSDNVLTVEGSATVSGTDFTNSAGVIEGAPLLGPVPQIIPSEYQHYADFILTSTGQVRYPGGALVCASLPCRGWTFSGGLPPGSGPTWIVDNNLLGGTYYVNGRVYSNNQIGNAATPLPLTLIATRSIELRSKAYINPDTPELLLVTGGDLRTSDEIDADDGNALTGGGKILVHEQWWSTGKIWLSDSQVIVENAPSPANDNPAPSNGFENEVEIIYNGPLGGGGAGGAGGYGVTGWWEVR